MTSAWNRADLGDPLVLDAAGQVLGAEALTVAVELAPGSEERRGRP